MFRKYLFVILSLLFCFDVYAGTIHSYTLKSPPDNADEIPIYDSSDGSTKKIQVGDISGNGGGTNWSSLDNISTLHNSDEFIINNSNTLNWENLQALLPSASGGWSDGGTNIYTTTTSDNVGIGTTTPMSGDKVTIAGGNFRFKGVADRTIGMNRETTASTAGHNLTIDTGGAVSGGTDLDGGDLILQSGQSTGTGKSNIILKTSKTSGSTGSSDNIISERLVIVGGRGITEDSATALFDIALSAGTTCGGTIFWETSNTDGTELQAYSGITSFAVVNKSGTYTTSLTQNPLNDAVASTSGTIQTTWSITNGSNKVTINVNNNSSFTPASGHPRINYQVMNNCYNTLTVL